MLTPSKDGRPPSALLVRITNTPTNTKMKTNTNIDVSDVKIVYVEHTFFHQKGYNFENEFLKNMNVGITFSIFS